VLIKDGCRMLNFESAYFEANAIDDKVNASDVHIDVVNWQKSVRVNINNSNFLRGGAGGFTPIRINRGVLSITGGTNFSSYQDSDVMIKIEEMVVNGTSVMIDESVNLGGGVVDNKTTGGGFK